MDCSSEWFVFLSIVGCAALIGLAVLAICGIVGWVGSVNGLKDKLEEMRNGSYGSLKYQDERIDRLCKDLVGLERLVKYRNKKAPWDCNIDGCPGMAHPCNRK